MTTTPTVKAVQGELDTHETITTTTTVDGAETITKKVISTVIENGAEDLGSIHSDAELYDPIIIQNESTLIGENGEIVKEITVTETHQVTSLKPVEVVVEEAEKQFEETVVEEGELDIAWLAGEIRSNVGIAALELNDDELSSEDITLISEALHVNTTLEKLDFQGNEIKDDGLLAIATALSINRHLREVYIGRQRFIASVHVERALAAAITKNEHLLVFTYSFQDASLRVQVDEALKRNSSAYAIFQSRKNVKTIYVTETTEVTTVKKERAVVKTAEEAAAEAEATAIATNKVIQARQPIIFEEPVVQEREIVLTTITASGDIPTDQYATLKHNVLEAISEHDDASAIVDAVDTVIFTESEDIETPMSLATIPEDIVTKDVSISHVGLTSKDQVDGVEDAVIIEESLDSIEVDDVVAEYANADEGGTIEEKILTQEHIEVLEDYDSSTKGKETDKSTGSSAEGSLKSKKITSVSQWPKVKDMAKTFEAVASATIQKPPPPVSKKTMTTKKTASTIPISSSLTRPTVASANKASSSSEPAKSANKTPIKQALATKRPSTSIPPISPRKSLVTPISKTAVATKVSASPTNGRNSVTTPSRTSVGSKLTSPVIRPPVKKIVAPKVPLAPTTSIRTVVSAFQIPQSSSKRNIQVPSSSTHSSLKGKAPISLMKLAEEEAEVTSILSHSFIPLSSLTISNQILETDDTNVVLLSTEVAPTNTYAAPIETVVSETTYVAPVETVISETTYVAPVETVISETIVTKILSEDVPIQTKELVVVEAVEQIAPVEIVTTEVVAETIEETPVAAVQEVVVKTVEAPVAIVIADAEANVAEEIAVTEAVVTEESAPKKLGLFGAIFGRRPSTTLTTTKTTTTTITTATVTGNEGVVEDQQGAPEVVEGSVVCETVVEETPAVETVEAALVLEAVDVPVERAVEVCDVPVVADVAEEAVAPVEVVECKEESIEIVAVAEVAPGAVVETVAETVETVVVETVVAETLIQDKESFVLETAEAPVEVVIAEAAVETATVEKAIAEVVPESTTETIVEKEIQEVVIQTADAPVDVVVADVVEACTVETVVDAAPIEEVIVAETVVVEESAPKKLGLFGSLFGRKPAASSTTTKTTTTTTTTTAISESEEATVVEEQVIDAPVVVETVVIETPVVEAIVEGVPVVVEAVDVPVERSVDVCAVPVVAEVEEEAVAAPVEVVATTAASETVSTEVTAEVVETVDGPAAEVVATETVVSETVVSETAVQEIPALEKDAIVEAAPIESVCEVVAEVITETVVQEAPIVVETADSPADVDAVESTTEGGPIEVAEVAPVEEIAVTETVVVDESAKKSSIFGSIFGRKPASGTSTTKTTTTTTITTVISGSEEEVVSVVEDVQATEATASVPVAVEVIVEEAPVVEAVVEETPCAVAEVTEAPAERAIESVVVEVEETVVVPVEVVEIAEVQVETAAEVIETPAAVVVETESTEPAHHRHGILHRIVETVGTAIETVEHKISDLIDPDVSEAEVVVSETTYVAPVETVVSETTYAAPIETVVSETTYVAPVETVISETTYVAPVETVISETIVTKILSEDVPIQTKELVVVEAVEQIAPVEIVTTEVVAETIEETPVAAVQEVVVKTVEAPVAIVIADAEANVAEEIAVTEAVVTEESAPKKLGLFGAIFGRRPSTTLTTTKTTTTTITTATVTGNEGVVEDQQGAPEVVEGSVVCETVVEETPAVETVEAALVLEAVDVPVERAVEVCDVPVVADVAEEAVAPVEVVECKEESIEIVVETEVIAGESVSVSPEVDIFEAAAVVEGNADMKWLVEEIASNSGIDALDLSNNNLSTEEVVAIAQALEVNITLEKLSLVGNEMSSDGIEALASALAVNQTLRELKIGQQSKFVSLDAEMALAGAIFQNTTIIRFTFTIQSDECRTIIERALTRNLESFTALNKTRTVFATQSAEVSSVEEVAEIHKEIKQLADEISHDVLGVTSRNTSTKDIHNGISTMDAAAPNVSVVEVVDSRVEVSTSCLEVASELVEKQVVVDKGLDIVVSETIGTEKFVEDDVVESSVIIADGLSSESVGTEVTETIVVSETNEIVAVSQVVAAEKYVAADVIQVVVEEFVIETATEVTDTVECSESNKVFVVEAVVDEEIRPVVSDTVTEVVETVVERTVETTETVDDAVAAACASVDVVEECTPEIAVADQTREIIVQEVVASKEPTTSQEIVEIVQTKVIETVEVTPVAVTESVAGVAEQVKNVSIELESICAETVVFEVYDTVAETAESGSVSVDANAIECTEAFAVEETKDIVEASDSGAVSLGAIAAEVIAVGSAETMVVAETKEVVVEAVHAIIVESSETVVVEEAKGVVEAADSAAAYVEAIAVESTEIAATVTAEICEQAVTVPFEKTITTEVVEQETVLTPDVVACSTSKQISETTIIEGSITEEVAEEQARGGCSELAEETVVSEVVEESVESKDITIPDGVSTSRDISVTKEVTAPTSSPVPLIIGIITLLIAVVAVVFVVLLPAEDGLILAAGSVCSCNTLIIWSNAYLFTPNSVLPHVISFLDKSVPCTNVTIVESAEGLETATEHADLNDIVILCLGSDDCTNSLIYAETSWNDEEQNPDSFYIRTQKLESGATVMAVDGLDRLNDDVFVAAFKTAVCQQEDAIIVESDTVIVATNETVDVVEVEREADDTVFVVEEDILL
ncbi:UNVERIFIED_CONTAM: hypothetical protein HDU68_008219 [Siphonaria sp. JEL0065]|nr:hypothetical protein HDU68_008219 [Siphonaria sp. JEL0065]